jgi:hypothetical protein
MDPHSIVGSGDGQDTPHADALASDWRGAPSSGAPAPKEEFALASGDGGQSLTNLARQDLNATLQLLAERSQYITAATGAAIALRSGENFVCRASAGTSAPGVGSLLQVDSGLSGESVRTKQTLRCDDASTDPRVNRESCEALGIASVMVMPLLRADVVIGVFELFSDKPNAFEPRDLTAMERMGALVFTVLEQAQEPAAPQDDLETSVATQTEHNDERPDLPAARGAAQASGEEEPGAPPVAVSPSIPQMNEQVEAGVAQSCASAEGAALPQAEPDPVPDAANAHPASALVFQGGMSGQSAPSTPPPTGVPEADAATTDIRTEDVPEPVEPKKLTAEISPHSETEESVLGDNAPSPESALGVADTVQSTAAANIGREVPAPLVIEVPSTTSAPQSEVAKLRRCEECGFPVSEGRQLCLDCEKKSKGKNSAVGISLGLGPPTDVPRPEARAPADAALDNTPGFPVDKPGKPSWLGTHKYLVGAIAIAVALIAAFLLTR